MHRLDQGSTVEGLAVGWSGGNGGGLQWERRHCWDRVWTAQGKSHTCAVAGTDDLVVSNALTGASRALGTDAGHDKGAQGRRPGLGC